MVAVKACLPFAWPLCKENEELCFACFGNSHDASNSHAMKSIWTDYYLKVQTYSEDCYQANEHFRHCRHTVVPSHIEPDCATIH